MPETKNRKPMIPTRPKNILLFTIVSFFAIADGNLRAQTADGRLAAPGNQSEFPLITAQPNDQTVLLGTKITLSTRAIGAAGYQWLRDGVPMAGQTNSNLVITNAGLNDVALYSCAVWKADGESVPTRAASVNVMAAGSSTGTAGLTGGSTFLVYGAPVSSSGVQNTCPGPYAGYVIYTKTIPKGWGWKPLAGASRVGAADGSGRTDTQIEYVGAYGDSGCNATSVIIPTPTFSPAYRFAIYFTNNVPTNAYPIVLTGFNP